MELSLADRYAAAKLDADRAAKALEDLKDEIKALGREEIDGVTCVVKLALISQKRVDLALIPEDIKDAAKREYVSERITVVAKGAK